MEKSPSSTVVMKMKGMSMGPIAIAVGKILMNMERMSTENSNRNLKRLDLISLSLKKK